MLNRNPSLHKYVFRPKDKDQFELEWYLTHRLLWLYQIVEHTCHQHQTPSSYHIHWLWPQLVRSQRKASSWEIWKKNWNSRHREIGPVEKSKISNRAKIIHSSQMSVPTKHLLTQKEDKTEISLFYADSCIVYQINFIWKVRIFPKASDLRCKNF